LIWPERARRVLPRVPPPVPVPADEAVARHPDERFRGGVIHGLIPIDVYSFRLEV
jgi:hypothetical protein